MQHAPKPAQRGSKIIIFNLIDRAQSIRGVAYFAIEVCESLNAFRAQILPHRSEHLNTQGVLRQGIFHGKEGIRYRRKRCGGFITAPCKSCGGCIGIKPQLLKGIICGAIFNPNAKFLNGITQLIHAKCAALCAVGKGIKHILRIKPQALKMHGIFIDAI